MSSHAPLIIHWPHSSQLAETAVYSLNKTSTRDFIERKAKSFGFSGTVIAQMRVRVVSASAFIPSRHWPDSPLPRTV